MRFRSHSVGLLAALSGCAFIDAARDEQPGPGGPGGLQFDRLNLDMASMNPPDAVIGQFDGVDGNDIVVLAGGAGGGNIIECIQNGTSGRDFTCSPMPGFGQFAVITSGDIDGDGIPDVVLAGLNKLTVLTTTGGTFVDHPITVALPAIMPTQVDVVKLAASTNPTIVLSFGNGTPKLVFDALTSPTSMDLPNAGDVRQLVHGNVDYADTDEEIVFSGPSGSMVSVLSGIAFDRKDEPLGPNGLGVDRLAVGDFAEGPLPDVAVNEANVTGNDTQILPGSTNGISHGTQTHFGLSTGDDFKGADLDGDGLLDLVVLSSDNTGMHRLSVFLAKGNTADATRFDVGITITVDKNPGRMRFGDLNDDGKADILLLQDTNNGGVDYLLSN